MVGDPSLLLIQGSISGIPSGFAYARCKELKKFRAFSYSLNIEAFRDLKEFETEKFQTFSYLGALYVSFIRQKAVTSHLGPITSRGYDITGL